MSHITISQSVPSPSISPMGNVIPLRLRIPRPRSILPQMPKKRSLRWAIPLAFLFVIYFSAIPLLVLITSKTLEVQIVGTMAVTFGLLFLQFIIAGYVASLSLLRPDKMKEILCRRAEKIILDK